MNAITRGEFSFAKDKVAGAFGIGELDPGYWNRQRSFAAARIAASL
jgi:hypothetical protein